jgi:hypothetical protein
MHPASHLRASVGRQFTLRSLFELTTICGVLAALSPTIGIEGAASIMFFALALHLRLGAMSLLALMAAFITTHTDSDSPFANSAFAQQAAVALAAAAVAAWYWSRSRVESLGAQKNPEHLARG